LEGGDSSDVVKFQSVTDRFGAIANGHGFTFGDLNNDGFSDIVLSFPRTEALGRPNAGQLQIVFGGPVRRTGVVDFTSLPAGEAATIFGAISGDFLGEGFSISQPLLASDADVDGDGIHDLVITAGNAFRNSRKEGEAYIIFGSETFPRQIDLSQLAGSGMGIVIESDGRTRFGNGVAVGDMNGDGLADVSIIDSAGNVHILWGDAALRQSTVLSAADRNDFDVIAYGSGGSIKPLSFPHIGDFNGDGLQDVALGYPSGDLPSIATPGLTHILFGAGKDRQISSLANITRGTADIADGLLVSGIAAGDTSGRVAVGPLDFNGDGYDDLLIGAPGADPRGNTSGQAYLVFGRENPSVQEGTGFFTVDVSLAERVVGMEFGSQPRPAVITGTVYRDVNQSGNRDAAEFGIESVIVFVDENTDSVFSKERFRERLMQPACSYSRAFRRWLHTRFVSSSPRDSRRHSPLIVQDSVSRHCQVKNSLDLSSESPTLLVVSVLGAVHWSGGFLLTPTRTANSMSARLDSAV